MPRKTRKSMNRRKGKTRKRKIKKKQTKVKRCVYKLKKKHKIGAAIAICQSSTRQNYRTGKKLKRKRNSRRKKRGGTAENPNEAPVYMFEPQIDDMVWDNITQSEGQVFDITHNGQYEIYLHREGEVLRTINQISPIQ